jgi:hypothetical protein
MNDKATKRLELAKKMWSDNTAKFADWFAKIKHGQLDANYEDCAAYKEALEFYQNFSHQDDVDYSAVVMFSRELFERYDKTDKALDDKADSIVKYLGGGSAVITAGALLAIKYDTVTNCIFSMVAILCLVPSLIAAFLAVSHAIHVRHPRDVAHLPDVKKAVEIAEFNKNKEEIDINIWLIYFPICEALLFRNMQKAESVCEAHRYYRLSIGLLAVPILGLLLALGVNAVYLSNSSGTETPKKGQSDTKAVQKP